MEITRCTKQDFDEILGNLGEFWDSDGMACHHSPILFYEFGDSAFVIREGSSVAGYLFGFLAQTEPVGYVRLIAVRRPYRGQGLGTQLYSRFEAYARERGCTRLRAITRPINRASIAFHRRLGMSLLGEPNADGIPVVKDYAGPGLDRVVFEMEIGSGHSAMSRANAASGE
jgi:GNAT superfamily N-acetyltransferase